MLLRALRCGTYIGMPGVAVHTGREVTVEADRPVPIYADGEPLTRHRVVVRLRPAALRLVGQPEPGQPTDSGSPRCHRCQWLRLPT
jgi:diacylglycerol kinase family enzyme